MKINSVNLCAALGALCVKNFKHREKEEKHRAPQRPNM
jgi:hypothetical protein